MGRRWCEADPTIRIGREVGKLIVTAPWESRRAATAVRLVVGVPAGTEVTTSQNAILGGDVTIESVDSTDDLTLTLTVETDGEAFPIIARFGPAGAHALPDLFGFGWSGQAVALGPVEASA